MTLHVVGVQKKYELFTLGPIDLEIKGGETIALLGPNGAGKSTLFQILTSNLRSDAGQVKLGDHLISPENFSARRMIAYQSQSNELPRWVNPKEALTYVAFLHQKPESLVEYFMEAFDLKPFEDKPLIGCSYGMLKRVGLAIAFLQQSPFLILDEPFSGLDLFHVKSLERELIARQSAGLSTLISTHDFAFVSKHASRCLFIEKGQMDESSDWPASGPAKRVELIEARFFRS
jgi:ABC-type multidrug transport system ATPase subunit